MGNGLELGCDNLTIFSKFTKITNATSRIPKHILSIVNIGRLYPTFCESTEVLSQHISELLAGFQRTT